LQLAITPVSDLNHWSRLDGWDFKFSICQSIWPICSLSTA